MQIRGFDLRLPLRLFVLASSLALVMAIELVAGQGMLTTLLDGELPAPTIAMILMMILTSTGAVVSTFVATIRMEPARVASTAAGSAMALLAGLEASDAGVRLPLHFYFWISLAAQATFTFGAAYVWFGLIKVKGKWAAYPPLLAGSLVVLYGTLGFIGQSWVPLLTTIAGMAWVRDLVLCVIPFGVLLAMAIARPLRLDQKSMVSAILLRLPRSEEQQAARATLATLSAGFLASALLSTPVHLSGITRLPEPGWGVLTALSLGWLGLLVGSLTTLMAFIREQRQGQVTAQLAPVSAKRFLRRHLSDDTAWAATMGLKSTNFMIDHDPNSFLEGQLPASIMQIRAEEIQRYVSDILGAMYLHSHVGGHRMIGALDPEVAVRPCIDTLRMFACLYLDAGPLVERRIKGLAALLPIVDPGLAVAIGTKDLPALIRRNQWFFYFDFGWIDQQVVHSPRTTRYDVQLSTLSSRVRNSMMDYLDRTGGAGNAVWIGPEARDRLIQEAPALRNVIEARPLEGEEVVLMFSIRFEHLIPRLQRYFDLDTMRASLQDFEPSAESSQLLQLLSLQINKATAPNEILELLAAIASVPWRGFKEKDSALHLILQAYNSLTSLLTFGRRLHEVHETAAREAYIKVLEAVKAVGYPSQILHDAQINKIALRDVKVLIGVASDLRHQRFAEAWLLLSSSEYQRYSLEQREVILDFLRQVPQKPRLAKHRLVQVKAVDALASLGRVVGSGELPMLDQTIGAMALWFAELQVDPDVCCLFLDALLFLSSHHGREHGLHAGALAALDQYFIKLESELGSSHAKVVAVLSRWQDFRARGPSSSIAAA